MLFSVTTCRRRSRTLDPTLLYVSPPFKSVLNNYVINLTRVLLDDQGHFAGVVSAAIDPVDLEILLNSVRYSDDMQATWCTAMARFSSVSLRLGASAGAGSVERQLAA